MTELASAGQLRGSLLRWALFTVPGVLLLGILSSRLAGNVSENAWFATLNKPALYPAPEVFQIVWTVLYIMMGLALANVAAARGAQWRTVAIAVFALQLAVNLGWSPLFFAGHQITAALALIILLDVLVLFTIWLFYRVRPEAALLLVPYLGWILFATVLNWQFQTANPEADGQDVSGAVTRIEL